MTRLGMAITAFQQKFDVENGAMAKSIGISASTLSRIKGGAMPDAIGMAKIVLWLAQETPKGAGETDEPPLSGPARDRLG